MVTEEKTGSAPHDCPNCGSPAYVGGPGMPTQCTSRVCPFYSEDCWVRWVMELPDEEEGVEFEIEDDEDTLPGLYGRFPRVSSWLPAPKDLGPKSAAKQAKVKGGGKLDLPSFSDLYASKGHRFVYE